MVKPEWKNDPLKPTLIKIVDIKYTIQQTGKYKGKKEGHKIGLYLCRCGNEFIKEVSRINTGNTRSCGCIHKGKYTGHPLQPMYRGMVQRCYNKNNKRYKHYGGRGITVCDRWLEKIKGFENFLEDMGERPEGKYSIDRINNNGNYEPSNCRWATASEQNRNYSKNRIIEYKGEKKIMIEWAEEKNIKYDTIHQRLNNGWSVEAAIETPLRKY
jgi:hypothetical protein